MNAEANCRPLSEIRESWRLKHLKIWERKSWAMPAASMFLEQGVRITPFVRPWLTTTIKESWPVDRERLVMRSMESCWNGRDEEEGIGDKGGHVG